MWSRNHVTDLKSTPGNLRSHVQRYLFVCWNEMVRNRLWLQLQLILFLAMDSSHETSSHARRARRYYTPKLFYANQQNIIAVSTLISKRQQQRRQPTNKHKYTENKCVRCEFSAVFFSLYILSFYFLFIYSYRAEWMNTHSIYECRRSTVRAIVFGVRVWTFSEQQ